MAITTLVQKFLENDITVPANTSVFDGINFTSNVIDLENVVSGSIVIMAKGSVAGASGNINFNFRASHDGVNWDSISIFTENISLSGTSYIQKTISKTFGMRYLKLYSIYNGDSSASATCNAVIVGKLA